ncbi:MAG: AMP-dependent synthetase/ligase [Thermoleophilaceae bacterium]
MESATQSRTHRPRGLDAKTMVEAFQVTAEDNAETVAVRTKDDEQSYTWAQYADKVERLARGFAGMGVAHGDTMGVMLTNRPAFHEVDSAAMHLGAAPFSIYNTYTAEQIEYLASDAGNSILVTEKAFLDTILAVRDKVKSVEHVVVVDGDGSNDTLTLDDVEAKGETSFDFESAWKAVKPEDILTVIYTSGTTGPPKGVQLSHANLMSAVSGIEDIIQFPEEGRVISWLPYAHIAERACSHYLPIVLGFTTTDCPDPRQVVAYLPEVRPTWFFAVPRIWEKLKAAIEAGIEHESDEDKKTAMKGALEMGLKKVRLEQAGEEVPEDLQKQYDAADEKIFSAIRERLGFDKAESLNVGAAPTPPEVIEFFHAIGIPLAELWGMSETCGAGCINPPDKIRIGTVGPPTPGVEIKLADDGEVMVKGGVVMQGYRNLPDKTKETFSDDGWLLTGDIGEFDDEGYLKIVDRKKELIINAAGKNMSPANIESHVKSGSPLIGYAIAIGDRRSYNVALITLDSDAAPGFAQKNGIEDSSPEALAGSEAVIAEVQRGVDAANEKLARVEQIKKFKVLPTDWEPGGDELTPTMKLKRKPIGEKYETEIEALYA